MQKLLFKDCFKLNSVESNGQRMRCIHVLVAMRLALGACTVLAQTPDGSAALSEHKLLRETVQASASLIQQYPNDPDHWLQRGIAQARQGLWIPAAQDLEKAVSLAPAYADAWSALADVYRWSDRPAAAADAYARLAVLRPDDAQVQVLRARSLAAVAEMEAAQLAQQQARVVIANKEVAPTSAEVPRQVALSPETLNQVAPSDAYKWAVSGGIYTSSAGSASARENSLVLRHYGALGSMAVERLSLRRFGLSDKAWAVDAYPRLWPGAYANLRYQYADSPALYPKRSWRVELYQNISGGWELAASRDFLGFGSGVRIDGVAVGKYWGNFFARWRHQQVHSDTSSGRGDRAFVRYYYQGDADHYVEANAARGRSDEFGSALINTSSSDSRGLVWYHFVTREWGFKLSASASTDSAGYGAKSQDLGVSLTRRW
jgi:YaiO family outer membrane protein